MYILYIIVIFSGTYIHSIINLAHDRIHNSLLVSCPSVESSKLGGNKNNQRHDEKNSLPLIFSITFCMATALSCFNLTG